ncbi:MAG: hypothetical protein ABIW30_03675, partial [Arenimonas sp.]
MQVKRPNILLIERRERSEFSLEALLSGGAGVVSHGEWVALAPVLGREQTLQFEDLAVFEALGTQASTSREELASRFGEARVAALVER